MARPVRTRLVGTMAVTALFAATATEASAQDRGLVLNEQLQLGDVIAGQRLNVVDPAEQVSASVSSQGNSLVGGTENQALDAYSRQDMQGATRSGLELNLGGQTNGIVNTTVQSRGNYLAGTATNAQLAVDVGQSTSGPVEAATVIAGDQTMLVGGAVMATSAIGNTTALAASGTASQRGSLIGTIDQSNSNSVSATTSGSPRLVRDPSDFSAQAMANAVQSTSGPNSNQELAIRQRSTGPVVNADVGIYAGNGWDLATRAQATANAATVFNQGGSAIVTTDQANSAFVRGEAELGSYDFGRATAMATASGNEVSVGNNDVYLELDNTQLNTGGVEASASFIGYQGYDAYVGANAVGNAVTGFVCADCTPNMNITNNQLNSGNVSATAQTVINSSGRHVITGTTAVGNSASFYTARPGN